MREQIQIAVQDILPDPAPVFALQGYPPNVHPDARALGIFKSAMGLLLGLARPVAVWMDITAEEFQSIYEGEGDNAPATPLERIYPQAEHFVLFAATLNEPVCDEIKALFANDDFALGAMLDSLASVAADLMGGRIEEHYLRTASSSPGPNSNGLMRYSPGYCGWHISAQKALFRRLRPEGIGITLRESYLMQPLKSISGVMLCGRPEIHRFRPDYPFCSECCTKSCVDRIKKMKKGRPPEVRSD
ncbi:MAG: hypothetical protein KJ970_20215 [Candidatus Eisenbacteria bacterium]|uniref:AdoMet activation domain-containing protein n=1 Tax=Eiseniibacteriota bacterium TaxID=2212470 RepID=A0A948W834_UNCEI|nr:hypothetical protein [Candidatus Eisenbacteria bacterium]MBU1947799.1 hypothetical protein [Candidatus Eisenbacteria bacterium]MBU2693249.1 hypothetical protein [Candidatus Eisenbacteria bacterium]